MTVKEIEEKFIELKHRRPFVPFAVELVDGEVIPVPDPAIAINYTGAGFIDLEGALVDIEFERVRAIRMGCVGTSA